MRGGTFEFTQEHLFAIYYTVSILNLNARNNAILKAQQLCFISLHNAFMLNSNISSMSAMSFILFLMFVLIAKLCVDYNQSAAGFPCDQQQ